MKLPFVLMLAVATFVAPSGSHAQAVPDGGTWSLHRGDRGDAHFDIRVENATGDSEYGRDEPAAHVIGLSASDLASRGASVTFDLVRDAGTFRCTGHVAAGRGGGTFRFTANPAYARELGAFGIEAPAVDEQRAMALADVSLTFVQTLHEARYAIRAPRDLIRLVDHGVRANFVTGLAREGYRLTSVDDLVRFADHGVTLDYVENVRALGYRPAAERFVAMVDHGVTADFAREVTSLGYRPTVDQLIAMVDHGVTVGFAREMAARDRKPDVDDLIRLRDAGI